MHLDSVIRASLLSCALLGALSCTAPRYSPCDDFGMCPAGGVCTNDGSRLCTQPCEFPQQCAQDEVCLGNGSCAPVGATAIGDVCTTGTRCVAGAFCEEQWVDYDPVAGATMSYGDVICRPLCPRDPHASVRPDQLNAPADDSACPVGMVCTYQFDTNLRLLDICVPACDPGIDSSCPLGMVCRYRECVDGTLAQTCADGSVCAVGQICDSEVSPSACLTPIGFDQAHPRPARTST